MTFAGALRRCLDASLVYVSIGGDVHATAPLSAVNTQQFPLKVRGYAAEHPDREVAIVLIDARWRAGIPRIIRELEGHWTSGEGFHPINMDNVTFYTIEAFFNDYNDTAAIVELLERSRVPDVEIIVGEFSLTHGIGPFDNFPQLGRAVRDHHLGYMADDRQQRIQTFQGPQGHEI